MENSWTGSLSSHRSVVLTIYNRGDLFQCIVENWLPFVWLHEVALGFKKVGDSCCLVCLQVTNSQQPKRLCSWDKAPWTLSPLSSTAASPRWLLTEWPAWQASTSQGTPAPAGASLSTTWRRTQTRASSGRCLVRLVPSQTSRLSVTSTQTSAKDLALWPWLTMTRRPWLLPAWMDTAWGTECYKSRLKPTKHTRPKTPLRLFIETQP